MSAVHTLVGTRYSAAGGKTGKSDLVAWRRGPEPRRGHSDDGRQSRCLGRPGCTARCGGVALTDAAISSDIAADETGEAYPQRWLQNRDGKLVSTRDETASSPTSSSRQNTVRAG